LCDAGDGQQRADDGTHGVDKSVRSSGRGSWATDECLQSAGKAAHAPCGCGPAPTSDLTQGRTGQANIRASVACESQQLSSSTSPVVRN
jgi:hypothetical protein